MEVAAAEAAVGDPRVRGGLVWQARYRLHAGLLLYPEPGRLAVLRQGAVWLEGASGGPAGAAGGEGEAALRAWLLGFDERDGAAMEALQGDWTRLFGVSRHDYCYPYEGAGAGDAAAAARALVELEATYAGAGLALATGDLPDHVSVELEYMSHLSGLAWRALEQGDPALAVRVQGAQRRFLEAHLCRWLPGLAARVAAVEGGIYARICASAVALVDAHLGELDAAGVEGDR